MNGAIRSHPQGNNENNEQSIFPFKAGPFSIKQIIPIISWSFLSLVNFLLLLPLKYLLQQQHPENIPIPVPTHSTTQNPSLHHNHPLHKTMYFHIPSLLILSLLSAGTLALPYKTINLAHKGISEEMASGAQIPHFHLPKRDNPPVPYVPSTDAE